MLLNNAFHVKEQYKQKEILRVSPDGQVPITDSSPLDKTPVLVQDSSRPSWCVHLMETHLTVAEEVIQGRDSYDRNAANYWSPTLKSTRQQTYSLLQEKSDRGEHGGDFFLSLQVNCKNHNHHQTSLLLICGGPGGICPNYHCKARSMRKASLLPWVLTQPKYSPTIHDWHNGTTGSHNLINYCIMLSLLKGWFSKTLVYKTYRQVMEK